MSKFIIKLKPLDRHLVRHFSEKSQGNPRTRNETSSQPKYQKFSQPDERALSPTPKFKTSERMTSKRDGYKEQFSTPSKKFPANWSSADKTNFRRIEEEDDDDESTEFLPSVHKRTPQHYRHLCRQLGAEGKVL